MYITYSTKWIHFIYIFSIFNMSENDFSVWYRGIPVVSKYWFSGTVIFPLLSRIGILSPWWLVLEYTLFLKKFQVGTINMNTDFFIYLNNWMLKIFIAMAARDCLVLLPNHASNRFQLFDYVVLFVQLLDSFRDRWLFYWKGFPNKFNSFHSRFVWWPASRLSFHAYLQLGLHYGNALGGVDQINDH